MSSAFWGQSFVTELNRISAHSAAKFQSRNAKLPESADAEKPTNNTGVSDENQKTQ